MMNQHESSGSAVDAIVDSMLPRDSDESIYFVMYRLGLKRIPLSKIMEHLERRGKQIRTKDIEQWQRGFDKSDPFAIPNDSPKVLLSLDEYPYLSGSWDPTDRYIPAIDPGHVLAKWGTQRHTKEEALSYRGVQLLGENLKGCHFIVIDVDGDHTGVPDMKVINYWESWIFRTKSLIKYDDDGIPVSFHLEFACDRMIPTMHFNKVDLLGNANNQARWLKPNKIDNCLPRADVSEVWKDLNRYVQGD